MAITIYKVYQVGIIFWNHSSIQVPPALYMAQWQLSGSGHIIAHLNLYLAM